MNFNGALSCSNVKQKPIRIYETHANATWQVAKYAHLRNDLYVRIFNAMRLEGMLYEYVDVYDVRVCGILTKLKQ